MALVSVTFILFFILVLVIYYLLPKKFQWMVLLVASIVFYLTSATPYTYIYILVSVITVYISTVKIEKIEDEIERETFAKNKLLKKKKQVYIVAVIICVSMLAILKYTNFILGNVNIVVKLLGQNTVISEVHWIASLGISFYTLQMVGYLTDVYWGISKAQKNIAKLALYNCYFPQIISGPISRYQDIEQDLFGEHKADKNNIAWGLLRILIGFFKKLVITEHLTLVTSVIFENPIEYGGFFVWIGTALYILQIYADFSGCMDIIMGVSGCFGIGLPENFQTPFSSVTTQEFWQRWHITLGTWLKDYIMYPILRSNLWKHYTKIVKKRWGKRCAKLLPMFAGMLILWLGMGLWHGGGWNFIGEGVWFWLVIVLGQLIGPWFKGKKEQHRINTNGKIWNYFCRIRTSIIFGVGMIFFKSANLGIAFYMIGSALSTQQLYISFFKLLGSVQMMDSAIGTAQLIWHFLSVLVGLVVLIVLGYMEERDAMLKKWFLKQSDFIKILTVYIILFSIVLMGAYGPGYSSSEFIYGGF